MKNTDNEKCVWCGKETVPLFHSSKMRYCPDCEKSRQNNESDQIELDLSLNPIIVHHVSLVGIMRQGSQPIERKVDIKVEINERRKQLFSVTGAIVEVTLEDINGEFIVTTNNNDWRAYAVHEDIITTKE